MGFPCVFRAPWVSAGPTDPTSEALSHRPTFGRPKGRSAETQVHFSPVGAGGGGSTEVPNADPPPPSTVW